MSHRGANALAMCQFVAFIANSDNPTNEHLLGGTDEHGERRMWRARRHDRLVERCQLLARHRLLGEAERPLQVQRLDQ